MVLDEGLGVGGGVPDAGVGCFEVALEGVSHADEVGSVGWGGGADGGHGVGVWGLLWVCGVCVVGSPVV